MKFKEYYLTEAKQVGILYHDTWKMYIDKIASSNTLIDPWKIGSKTAFGDIKKRGEISVTRNKNLVWAEIKLILDGNKISNKYKVKPVAVRGNGRDDPYEELAEEFIITQNLKDLRSYIKGIAIYGDIEMRDLDEVVTVYSSIMSLNPKKLYLIKDSSNTVSKWKEISAKDLANLLEKNINK